MSLGRKLRDRVLRRARRVRSRLTIDAGKSRVSVFRSLCHINAQIIDDVASHTLASCSSREFSESLKKTDVAAQVGKELARRAQEKGVTEVVFDRGAFRYHGRVKAFAEGLRAGGLKF